MDNYLGKFLGEGKSRKVFEYLPDPSYVIKLNKTANDINLLEFNTYLYFKECDLNYLLAPCKYENGNFIMKKVKHPNVGIYDVPCYFSKKDYNWGQLDDKLVRIDYAWNIISINDETYISIDNENLKNLSNVPSIIVEQKYNLSLIKLNPNYLKLWTTYTHKYEVK
jgi:hypothetical protein